jgi:autotransporter-associated beta strand protein
LNNTGTGSPSPGYAEFGLLLNFALTANQTWTTSGNLKVGGGSSGAYALTKAGTGYLALSGTHGFSALSVNAGTLYLGQGASAGSGAVTLASGSTLGTLGSEVVMSNTLNVGTGALIGGALGGGAAEYSLSGVTMVGTTTPTLNVANADVYITGALSGSPGTTLTIDSDGTGVVILAGTQSNISNLVADGAAVVFGNTGALPSTSIQAVNGGYVGIGEIEATTPTMASVLGLITNKASFNGVLGFDTSEDHSNGEFATFSENINLAGFTSGQVRLGSLTSAILTGTITPAGQSHDFGGYTSQGGGLVVQSSLTDNGGATGVTVVSPDAAGGAAQDGIVVILQGNNTFTGNLSVDHASVILDSVNALPSGKTFSLDDLSYVGYTEGATGFSTFADFVARRASHTSTSILGLDSANFISEITGGAGGAERTFTGTIDLSALNPIFLGTLTGVTLDSSAVLKASNDGALRLVSMSDNGMTVNAKIDAANVTSLVAGLPGSEGIITLNSSLNDYTGGTTLQGGALLVGHANALGAGNVTTSATSGDRVVLGAATNGIAIGNNIAVGGNGMSLGLGDREGGFSAGTNSLTVNGVISGSGRVTVEAPTVLAGGNTNTGGISIWANTTVTNDAGLGSTSGTVDVGRNATLTFSTATPAIGNLASSSQFDSSAGTGTISLGSGVLTINQASNFTFSGVISGTGGLTKNGTATLTLPASNTYTGVTTLSAGTLSVSAIGNGGSAGGLGAASNAASNLVFNGTGGGGAVMYTGSTASTDRNFTINAGKTATFAVANSGANLTLSGASTSTNGGLIKNGPGTLTLSGTNLHTGVTTLNGGVLSVSTIGNGGVSGNLGAASSAASNLVFNGNGNGAGALLYTGATASTDRGFTINSGRTAVINVSNSGTNLTIGGSSGTGGGLTKTGAGTLTLGGTYAYTGATTVSSGTLLVNGSISSSTFSVVSGATLGGSGTVGAVSIASGATLAPGSSAGLLSTGNLSLLGTTMMELGGTTRGSGGYDAIDVAGNITFGGTLSVSLINSYSPVSGASFNLFDWTGTPSGTFSTLNLPSLSGGLTWDTSNLYTAGTITASAIPEPSTYAALVGLAAFGLVCWRRRSRPA